MWLLMLLATCGAVGWMAQTAKGRTGALWAALTVLPCAFFWSAMILAGATRAQAATSAALDRSAGAGASTTLRDAVACTLGGGLMALIVWSLPKRST